MNAEHLYVHVPFCARRCVYCDFSIAVRASVPEAEYLDALARELDARHRTSRFTLSTLYFGGGTPSRLGADGVRRLMDLVRERVSLREHAEVTLEANPDDVSVAAVRAWRDAGVNRLSLGVQSFDDRVLVWMHRSHDAESARRAVSDAREGGIPEISADLIFATPAEVPRIWDRDLDAALQLEVPHLSVYGLTIEPHTPLGRWVARSDASEAPEDEFEREFLRAHEVLTAAGFEHYEVSNYAIAGHHSNHNQAYWARRPYGGLGPSAHEFDGMVRRWNVSAYAPWLRAARDAGETTAGFERLDESQAAAECVYLALRTLEGVRLLPQDHMVVRPWIDAGWAEVVDRDRLRLTATGWLRLDALSNALTIARSR